MANHDVKNDVTPVNTWKPTSEPTIAELRAALTAHNATSYSSTRLDTMTELDMVYACRQHGLTVNGL